MTVTRKDKTDIILALRETAKGLEKVALTESVTLEFIQALGTELLVLALKHGPLLDRINGPDVAEADKPAREAALEMLIRREVAAIADTVATAHEGRIREIDVIHERLMRMFDPAPAFNEAVNRAIEAKKAKLEVAVTMTPPQKFAFEHFQVPTLMNALFNAGHEDPVQLVQRVTNGTMTAMNNAMAKPAPMTLGAIRESLRLAVSDPDAVEVRFVHDDVTYRGEVVYRLSEKYDAKIVLSRIDAISGRAALRS